MLPRHGILTLVETPGIGRTRRPLWKMSVDLFMSGAFSLFYLLELAPSVWNPQTMDVSTAWLSGAGAVAMLTWLWMTLREFASLRRPYPILTNP